MKTRKERIHVKDQYYAGLQCDCGYKSTEPQHTPTPWSIDCMRQGTGTILELCTVSSGEDTVIPTVSTANAAFIVRAVNSHDELVQRLRKAYMQLHHEWKHLNEFENCGFASCREHLQAIAKAEGK